MYYFPSRKVAGDMLADQLTKYRYEDCAVIALGDGAVIVGAQIAARLHCPLNMLITEDIKLLGENDVLAEINQHGGVTFNSMYSQSEIDAMREENQTYIEQQKLEKLFDINRLLGQGGVIKPDLLRNRNIIVVSDGLLDGLPMQAATEYLKPIRIQRLIMATPFASVSAVDRMHILADEIVCLNVIEDIISIDHYYDDNRMPPHEKLIQILEDIILNWK